MKRRRVRVGGVVFRLLLHRRELPVAIAGNGRGGVAISRWIMGSLSFVVVRNRHLIDIMLLRRHNVVTRVVGLTKIRILYGKAKQSRQ